MSKIKYYLLSFLTVVSLIPILCISIYSRPCADDYNYSIKTHPVVEENSWNFLGVLLKAIETDWDFYKHWQGLYSSAFLLSLQPGIFSPKLYFLGTFFILVFFFVALSYLVLTLREYINIRKSGCYLLSLVLTVYLFQKLPSPVEGLFWFNGACNYIPFLACVIANIAVIVRACKSGSRKLIIFSSFLSFVISGGNHITSFLNILILFFGLLLFYKKRWQVFVPPFMTAIIGFIIMYFAPGTAVRQASLGPHADFFHTIGASVLHSLYLFRSWMNIEWLVLVSLCGLFAAEHINMSNKKAINPLFCLIVLFCILIGRVSSFSFQKQG